jgi:uncharacterized membrane protein
VTWPRVTLLLSLIGLGLSSYLTVEHYDHNAGLACPATATISCLKVTTSPQSVILGVPVAVLGLAFYAAMVALTLPIAWRTSSLGVVRQVAAGSGAVMVLYLVYVELFKVDAICLWCTGVHIVTIALLAVVLFVDPARVPDPAGSG